ncbi:PREDICTED: protein WVD2-like 5 isoform X2 [Tarenaya hassleriana]|uniref:protein WVD2-like 5 isoform X2 n=1 Tax=Tarenaya hassleriana TaxID=28532 RepID=UPI00053C6884|nr:PREDICTED: protein WVD2-like 5 isoform X2 [Tarenaya hassleriana]
MDSKNIIAVDGTESALENGSVANEAPAAAENGVVSNWLNGTTGEILESESEIRNEDSGSLANLGGSQNIKKATMGTQVENVNDPKHSRAKKAQGKVKGEKSSAGKNASSVSVKKKDSNEKNAEAKVAASNGPTAHTAKSLKSKSFNDRQARVMKHGQHDTEPTEAAGEKTELKPLKKQSHDTSEGDSESSNPKAEDGKSRRVGALPNYGFSFKCDQRAEKRREFYTKLEEKIHAKELEKNDMQAKSKETQEAEIKMLRKSLNFKATPMPSFYQEPQPPKVELKKIPPTRPKSPKLGRKKIVSVADSEESTEQTPRIGRLSLDEKGSKISLGAKETLPVDSKKPHLRRSLPRLPSQKAGLSNGKNEGKALPLAKAGADSMKAKPEKTKPEKDEDSTNQDQAPTAETSNAHQDARDQSTREEDKAESPMALEHVPVEH